MPNFVFLYPNLSFYWFIFLSFI